MALNNTTPSGTKIQGILENALLEAPFPIVIFEGIDLKVTYINDALLEIWGKDRSVLGQTFIEILPELEDQPFPALLKKVYQTGIAHTDNEALAYFVRDGISIEVYFDYSYTAIKDNEGTIIGVLVICRDVTQQVIAKRQVEESEAKFKNTVLQAPVAMAVLQGSDFIIETANERVLEIWGRNKEVIGKTVADVFPELIEQKFIDLLNNVYNTGQAFYGNELPIQLQNEHKSWTVYLNFVYQPILENGVVSSIIAVAYDVTDLVNARKSAEERGTLLAYLNKAGEELALTLDTQTALDKISSLSKINLSER